VIARSRAALCVPIWLRMTATNPDTAPRCPICGKPTAERYRPFCGKRCADVDLNRWLSGAYVVPGKAEEEEDELPSAPHESDDRH